MTLLSINMLVWNRARLTKLTLDSIIRVLPNKSISWEINILDQASDEQTLVMLETFTNLHSNINLYKSDRNIGMTNGWINLLQKSHGIFILNLENDWFCDTYSSKFIIESILILHNNDDIKFVKSRHLEDQDNFGYNIPTHSPWNFNNLDKNIVAKYNLNNYSFFKVFAPYTSYTFNPVIMKKSFAITASKYFMDNPSNPTPLRSGEDAVDTWWRSTQFYCAVLTPGVFKHTGFYKFWTALRFLPFYFLKNFGYDILKMCRGGNLIRKSLRYFPSN